MNMMEKTGLTDMNKNEAWEPREDYSLTLMEIHFLFSEFINNYSKKQLEEIRTVRDIEELRGWLTNAAIFGTRL